MTMDNETDKKTIRTRRGVREYTYLGCPLTRNRSAWCYRLCVPDPEGKGQCGRVAPHGLKGKTGLALKQYASERQRRESLHSHCASLEQMYLASYSVLHDDVGILVTDGGADIVIPIQASMVSANGSIRSSICLAAACEAGAFSVNSMVTDMLVMAESLTFNLTHEVARGDLIARAGVVSVSEQHFVADAVLMDAEQKELGRGTGTYVKSEVSLSAAIGYALTGELFKIDETALR